MIPTRALAPLAAALVAAGIAAAQERPVSGSGELAAAVAAAKAGDRIVLAPGKYEAGGLSLGTVPLVIEAAAGGEDGPRPVLSAGEGDSDYMLVIPEQAGAAGATGAVLLRGLVFDGRGRDVGGVQALSTRLEVEDCEFRDFAGKKKPMVSSRYGKSKGAHKGLRVSRCVFRKNPVSGAIASLGESLVEDCTIENVRGGMSFNDWSGKWGHKDRRNYKVVIRRNHIYRTEGTDWKCHGLTTRTTAPEIHDNLIHDLSKGDCSAMTVASNGFDAKGVATAARVFRNVIIDRWRAADSGMIHEAIEYGEYFPTKGRIYENVVIGRVRCSPSFYNKGSHNEWYGNSQHGTCRFFNCYGTHCRYYNNVQVGGTADGSYYPRKEIPKYKGTKTEVEPGVFEHSCLFKVRSSFDAGKGCFEADPKYVDPDGMDLHLRFDSPCINKGTGSRDGLTPTDIGAFEYPIQVCGFKVAPEGVCSWEWANGFRKVAARVRIRWHPERFCESAEGTGGVTLAEVDARGVASAATGKRSGCFAAFVKDVKGRWSAPTPDGVHGAAIGSSARPKPGNPFFPDTPQPREEQ